VRRASDASGPKGEKDHHFDASFALARVASKRSLSSSRARRRVMLLKSSLAGRWEPESSLRGFGCRLCVGLSTVI
jgi:hypothetical protein